MQNQQEKETHIGVHVENVVQWTQKKKVCVAGKTEKFLSTIFEGKLCITENENFSVVCIHREFLQTTLYVE